MGEITEFVANSDAQKSGLLSRVASDKGYVGVHSAGDSFRGCPEYRAFVDGHIVNRLAEMRHDVEAVENMHGPARLLGVERAEFAKTSSGNEYSVSSEPKYPFPTEARHAAGIPSGGARVVLFALPADSGCRIWRLCPCGGNASTRLYSSRLKIHREPRRLDLQVWRPTLTRML